jgi:hypothetical protein
MPTRRWLTQYALWRATLVLLISGSTAIAAETHAASDSIATPLSATSATNPTGETTMSFNQSLDKVSQVFLQLLTILQTQGVDAARQYAVDQGLMTTLDEIRVTVVLDSDDTTTVDDTAIAIGRIGGRVTATFDDTIEIVVPMQTIVDSLTQAMQGMSGPSFFQSLADFAHVTGIRRTPLARPAARISAGP